MHLANPIHKLRVVFLLGAALTAFGCATSPEETTKPAIKSIALVPASNPKAVSYESRSTAAVLLPFANIANSIDSKNRRAQLTMAMQVDRLGLGDKLTEVVAEELRRAGYRVDILSGIARPADYPDNIDPRTIKSDSDAILQLIVNDVGIYSGFMSDSYVPRVTGYGLMYATGRRRPLFDGETHFGAHAEKGKDWAVEIDPKYTYSGPDQVVAKVDEVRTVFTNGTVATGKRMAQRILAAIR